MRKPKTKLELLSKLDKANPNCRICIGRGWVCENHDTIPWSGLGPKGEDECCGGAGAPCRCNPLARVSFTKVIAEVNE